MWVIENTNHRGNCRLFWRMNGSGYTTNLEDAWKVERAQAISICGSRPEQDIPQEYEEMKKAAVLHVPRP